GALVLRRRPRRRTVPSPDARGVVEGQGRPRRPRASRDSSPRPATPSGTPCPSARSLPGGQPMIVAVGYVRRSHAADDRSVSLAAQREAIERYATEKGWILAALVEHDGVSGGKRSRFGQLDAVIKAHGARIVVAYSIDRLGRDAVGLMSWLAAVDKRKVECH